MPKDSPPKSPLSTLGLIIWGIAALFFLYEFFLRTVIGSLAHQVIPDLHLNAETFAIIGSAYYIAYGIMQLPVGILADKFGVKIILIFATLVCGIATFIFSHASSFESALISRLLMGFGSSFAFVCLLVVAMTWFPKKYFGFFAGASQLIGTLGPILAAGPLITWMKVSGLDWRIILNKIGYIGIILSILVLLIVKNKPRNGERAFILLQHPLPLKTLLYRLFANKQAWFVALYSASSYVSIALLGAIWGTEYLQSAGLSQDIAGDMISFAWLGYGISCPLLGALSDIAKRRKPTMIFCSIIGLLSTSTLIYAPINQFHWLYGLLCFGLGIAASGQNIGFATIAEHVHSKTRATAMGFNNGAITAFSAFIPPLVSYFIYQSAGANATKLSPENFTVGFSIMPVLYIISILTASLLVQETYCKPQKEAIKLTIK